jgi:transcription-repair coupling factor (superfamily II helicase)
LKNLVSIYSQKFHSIDEIQKNLKEGSEFQFFGVPRGANSFLTGVLKSYFSESSLLVICPFNSDAEILYRESLSFVEKDKLVYLPGIESIPYEHTHYSPELKKDRIKALSAILTQKQILVFTSVAGILQTVPPKKTLTDKSILIQKGQSIDPKKLVSLLVDSGYRRETACEVYGDFSVKGEIIDVFSPYSNFPVRLDFFDEEVESIKFFDPDTQRSVQEISETIILPADEFCLTQEEKRKYREIVQSFPFHLQKPILEEGSTVFLEELIPLVHEPSGILSYFSGKPVLVFPEPNDVVERAHQLWREISILYQKRKEEIVCLPPDSIYSQGIEWNFITNKSGICFSPIQSNLTTPNSFLLNWKEADSFKGKIREVREKIQSLYTEEGARILITSSFSAQTERLASLFQSDKIEILNSNSQDVSLVNIPEKSPGLFLVLSELRVGFVLPDEKIHIWSDNDIFGRSYKRKTRFKKTSSRMIDSFIDLKEGDFVVHVNHGIGRFNKLEKVQADGKLRDYLKLEYSGGDTLLVPLDQISLVQRYVGGSESPALDSLGKSSGWKKKIERAKGSVSKLAEDLMVMYLNRMNLEGYAFPPDSVWQEEFEAEFEYEETPDQLSAIEAVKADLESKRPMDRLVCGDVGYGKTEVAIRAAFKVIMAGKQVLFIAPTTILALQHYNTLRERYKNFPIQLEMVSRFRSPKEVKEIIAKFSRGELDLLVGTHALLNSNSKPKNLGLLIIDEEQRFGVNQKESIKKYKNLVDVLTLSATPIPRTLHMSLIGIRDLSIIETPPKNRLNVETYVVAENEEIICSAIQKELDRDGQVFFLHNRVETIEQEAAQLSKILPHVSIGILHGQLTEEEVEETILDFNNRKYDILVTTTIIESGIDMPNVNTILVKRADTFGLSQLYQIRGRVGRGGRKAYAYLFYPPNLALSEQAEKRLNTIQEYQELGSGFKVAMKDLEIRGAGNLLGNEQSGNIMEIGFDLYVKMLTEEVSRLKKEEVQVEVRTAMNLSVNFHIPEEYIYDPKQKIEFYKRFEGAVDLEEVEELSKEMQDRFGEFPPDVCTFVLLEKIRVLASRLGFDSISELDGEIRLKAGKYFKGDSSKIIQLISDKKSGLSVLPKEPNVLKFQLTDKQEKKKLTELLKLLTKLK